MRITKKWLQKHDACSEAYDAFIAHKPFKSDLAVINAAMDLDRFDWASWVLVELMDTEQQVKFACFCAEAVLDIFEREFPGDNRPRKAIETAWAYLANPCEETREAAADAAAAAYAAADANAAAYAAADAAAAANAAAYAAADANAAAAAAAAANAAADAAAYAAAAADAADAAANAAAAAADAAYAAADAAVKKEIINYGLKLLNLQ